MRQRSRKAKITNLVKESIFNVVDENDTVASQVKLSLIEDLVDLDQVVILEEKRTRMMARKELQKRKV